MRATLGMRTIFLVTMLAGVALFVATSEISAADWPGFLGPDRNGISTEKGLNTDWVAKPPKQLYRVPLGGGFSSLCVVGDRIYTQAIRGNNEAVVGIEAATGRVLWTRDVCSVYLDQQKQGSGPRATPTFADGQLFCQFPGGDFVCLNAADGQPVWNVNLLQAARIDNVLSEEFYWGLSQSPLVEGERVIVCPGGVRKTSVMGLDRRTGQVVWSGGADPPGYGSPVVATIQGQRQVICTGGVSLMAFEPQDGTPLWRLPFGNKYNCNCATPVVLDQRIFYSAAYGNGSILFEPTKAADRWNTKPVWTNRALLSHMATPIIIDGHVYGCSGDLGANTLRCLELAKGAVKWTERTPGKCTMVAYEGHIVLVSEDGTVRLIEANPKKYVEKGRADQLLKSRAWTPPAIADGKLYLRDQHELFCFDLK